MKKISFLFILIIIGYIVKCSDYILKYEPGLEIIECKSIQISDNYVSILNLQDEHLKLSIDDIFDIYFYSDKADEIKIFSLKIDTIVCTIESISRKEVFYRDSDNIPKIIKREDIFCIQFDELNDIDRINEYKSLYIDTYKKRYKQNLKITKNDGSQTNIHTLKAMDNDKLDIIIDRNGVLLATFVPKNNIRSIQLKDISTASFSISASNFDYLLTKKGIWRETRVIRVLPDRLIVNTLINNTYIDIEQEKSGIAGIFFTNYQKASQSINTNQLYDKKQPQHNMFKIDINGGFGYMFAKFADGLNEEEKKYLNELRSGYSIDLNLIVLPNRNFGFGIKYNAFFTSNSIGNIAEDNIRYSLIAGTLLVNAPFSGNTGNFYTEFSIGNFKLTNNAKIYNQDILITGNNIGGYLGMGVDFLLGPNVALGLKTGLLIGTIKKIKVNDRPVQTDNSDNSRRLDGMVGLKFYF